MEATQIGSTEGNTFNPDPPKKPKDRRCCGLAKRILHENPKKLWIHQKMPDGSVRVRLLTAEEQAFYLKSRQAAAKVTNMLVVLGIAYFLGWGTGWI